MRRLVGVAPLLGLVACAAPGWQNDVLQALSSARGRTELVVYFALEGRTASDKMQARLGDPLVLAALNRGGFEAVVVDGFARSNLYGEWIGGGEGMGIAVLGADGDVYAARPGPQDPEELAAFLDMCRGARAELAAARRAHEQSGGGALQSHRLGCVYLRLGCRVKSEPLLLDAALAGVPDARHRVARLYALDGNVTAARRWLEHVRETPASRMTEGYVLYKERRYIDSARVLDAALTAGGLGEDEQRARLFLGKALHYAGDDARAVPMLETLSREGRGSTFEAAALHMLIHIRDPQHGHSH